jgi:dimethylaniline monooxygenase (N-oxide forming)
MWWTSLLLSHMPLPKSSPHYHLLSAPSSRIQYGVDHSAYMSTLAKDFGGAPGLLELWKQCGWKVLLAYSFGASFVTFYRLTGPFAFKDARRITETELAETILRRGYLGNLFFGVIPMLFYGALNAIAWGLEMLGLIKSERNIV